VRHFGCGYVLRSVPFFPVFFCEFCFFCFAPMKTFFRGLNAGSFRLAPSFEQAGIASMESGGSEAYPANAVT